MSRTIREQAMLTATEKQPHLWPCRADAQPPGGFVLPHLCSRPFALAQPCYSWETISTHMGVSPTAKFSSGSSAPVRGLMAKEAMRPERVPVV